MHLAINDVLAKRNVRKEETVPMDGTLITRMMDANFSASHTPYSYSQNMVEGMTAAARVIAERYSSYHLSRAQLIHDLVGFVPHVVDEFLELSPCPNRSQDKDARGARDDHNYAQWARVLWMASSATGSRNLVIRRTTNFSLNYCVSA